MKIRYPITFNAAILERRNEPLVVDKVIFTGPLEPGQVLVRLHFSGICGKQIEEIQGLVRKDPYLPHMLGHEGSGVVIDIGPGVKKVLPGDHVVLHWLKGSGIDAATPRYTRSGKRVNAGWVTTFNEYGAVSENRLTIIPKEADLEAACLLGCAVTTGVGVILNEAKPNPGDCVAVFGCGGVGLNSIQAAALIHAYPIIAFDNNPRALSLAVKFGASHAINLNSNDLTGKMNKITNGKGAKFVIVAVGKPKVIEIAARSSSIPGNIFLVGVPPASSAISINPFSIHMQRTITGSCGGGCIPDRDIPLYLDLYKNGFLKIKELISQTFSLYKINEGIKLMLSGRNTGRCIIKLL